MLEKGREGGENEVGERDKRGKWQDVKEVL